MLNSNNTRKIDFEAAGLDLSGLNFAVLPLWETDAAENCACRDPKCTDRGKHPRIKKWRENSSASADQIIKWSRAWPRANIGVDCGKSGLVCIDLDEKNGQTGIANFEALGFDLGEPLIQWTPTGGKHLVYLDTTDGAICNSEGKLAPGVDVRGNGGYFIAAPSMIGTRSYRRESEWLFDPGPLPDDLAAALLKLQEPPALAPLPANGNGYHFEPNLQKWVDYAIRRQRETGKRNRAVYDYGQQVGSDGIPQGGGLAALPAILAAFPAKDHAFTPKEAERAYMSGYDDRFNEPARGALIDFSKRGEAGELAPASTAPEPPPPPAFPDGWDAQPENVTDRLRTDQADALEWSEILRRNEAGDADAVEHFCIDKIVFDHSLGEWFVWDKNHWEADRTGSVYGLVSNLIASHYLRAAADALQAGRDELAKDLTRRSSQLGSRRRIDNVLHLARSRSGLSLAGDEWDTNPWVLGVKNGVIDLKTGAIRAGKPTDYIRAYAPVEWQGLDAAAPIWERFLTQIFEGEPEIPPFLARLLGYGITGQTTEHVLPFLYGEDGRNGKSTLVETIGDVLGADLAAPSEAAALMDSGGSSGGPRPFVYALRGKRFVWASETKEGQRIDAGLVKLLTGGDTLFVRTLHSKPVRFKPTHLIMLLANNKPHISAEDSAMWERVLLIPFVWRFVENPQEKNERKRDTRLGERLRAEAPGILAWLVQGCLEWQRDGLKAPGVVRDATEEYKDEEDVFAVFLEECTSRVEGAETRSDALYTEYSGWCARIGERNPMSITAFGKRMKRRFSHKRSNGIVYLGIGLSARRTNPNAP